jgi:hypothetical protein
MINGVKIRRTRKEFILIHQHRVICRLEDLQNMHQIRLFYVGIKPVVSICFDKQNLPQRLMEQFPHIIKESKHDHNFLSVILFQNQNLKNIYIQECKKSSTKDFDFAKFGELLGYPPVATQDFLDRRNKELFGKIELFSWKIIYFHGIEFLCKEEHVSECLSWLDNEYQIPTDYQIEVRVWDAFKTRIKTA